jgi:hypothetical protein
LSNLILALITVAIVIGAITGFAQGSVRPQATLSNSYKAMEARAGEAARTGMASLSVSVQSAGARVDWTIRNSGQTKLRDFSGWDMVIQYQDQPTTGWVIKRLAYTTANPPGTNQWTVTGIYLTAPTTPEKYEPGIVNPSEEFVIRMQLSPAIAQNTNNSLTLAVLNGVTATALFSN